ncbi:hypothetical protein SUGI_0588420 [Cryptomeria japonica]|nr:hypothetical protein SUGI_0588420 [Cryptomeria japonica]
MHRTGSFLLQDIQTSRACMAAIQSQMESQGVARQNNVFNGCKIQPQDYVNGPTPCHSIQNKNSFENAVNTSEIKRSCDGDKNRFFCHVCLRAMVRVLRQLMEKDGKATNNCELFVIIYVGGAINGYEGLGPDAAYCLLSAQHLPDLASVGAGASMGAGSNPRERSSRSKKKITLALKVLLPAAAILTFISLYIAKRKFCGGRLKRLVLSRRESQLLRESVDLTTGLLFFRYSDLRQSTGNFAAANVIGEGGFGTVFRGTLPDGSQIAVKRFNDLTTAGDEVFKHEAHVISSVKHRNLLPLKGYCIHVSTRGHGHQHFLVYDLMPNGSLADYLFRRGGNKPLLTWPQRHRIAIGIARGLAYLHGDAKPAIIHRDVKAANVLLDADLNALVADFGLARFKEEESNKTHYTTRAVGTLGYVAPEYALYGHLTDKSDVYSFGILLLELLSGRRALDIAGPESHVLSEWAYELAQGGRVEEVIEETIREEESEGKEMMERVVFLALQCADARSACRPSIQQALSMLESTDRPDHPLVLPNTPSAFSSMLSRWDSLASSVGTERTSNGGSGSMAVSSISTNSYQTGR